MRAWARCLLAGAVVAGLSGFSVHADGGESPSFRLRRSSLNGGGAPTTSGSFRLTGSFAQATTVGTSAAPRFVLQSGFWGFLGSGLVPVTLSVARNALNDENVDLSWSGNNPPYEIFQSDDCADVFGALFDTTSSNAYADIPPPTTSLTCYRVLATAPGR